MRAVTVGKKAKKTAMMHDRANLRSTARAANCHLGGAAANGRRRA
jgi:hypothetical protein